MGNTKKWELADTEVAYYTPKSGYANVDSLQVFIPKILVRQSLGLPKISAPKTLNSSCLINDKSCKPAVSKSVKTQNFLTVKRNKNDIFKGSILKHGDQVLISVLHGDINNMRVTNRIDNSHRTK